MDWFGSGLGEVEGFYKWDNEIPGFIKCGDCIFSSVFLIQLEGFS